MEPRRYLRSHDDRVLGGVAGGLGKAFGVDAVIFRIALGALVFAGGFGVLAYLLALLIVPADDGTGQPLPRRATWRTLAVGALALLGAGVLFWGAAWLTAAGGGVAVAIVVIALGVALLVGAVRGDKRARWLAVPALVLAFPASVVAATGVSLDGGVGERSFRPTGADRLPAGYELGVGELVVDLRGLDWTGGRRVALDLDVGVGYAQVLVPEAVCVSARSAVGAGHAGVLADVADGLEVSHEVRRTPAAGVPALALDVEVGIGAFEVLHAPASAQERTGPRRMETRRIADRACTGGRG